MLASSPPLPPAPPSLASSAVHMRKFSQDLTIKFSCSECRSANPNLIEDYASGDVVCRDCGVVVHDRIIDTRSEWRSFANDGTSGNDDPSRVGGPQDPLMYGEGDDETLTIESTLISSLPKGKDGSSFSSSGSSSGSSFDLAKIQNKTSMKASDRNIIHAFKNISIISERIGLPKRIADCAKHLFKKVEDGKLLKGKPMDGIIAACVYIACRMERVTRTFKEISLLTMIPKKDIGRCYKALFPYLYPQGEIHTNGAITPKMTSALMQPNLSASKAVAGGSGGGSPTEAQLSTSSSASVPAVAALKAESPVESPSLSPLIALNGEEQRPMGSIIYIQDFMARFCSNLSLPMEVQKSALQLCQKVQFLDCLSGKSPVSIAATIIYMVTLLHPQYRRPARDISMVTGISELTIKNTYKELYPHRHIIISPDVASKHSIENMHPS
ncbi:transcription initiation factor IIB [Mitosporidium daphniae]